MFGWAGRILRVNLSNLETKVDLLKPDFAKAFLGGRGFNSKILYDEFDPDIADPFSPENVLCISAGLFGGTLVPSSGRITVSVARSPVTGVFGDGNAGGHFGPELKYAGYDAIILKGAAEKPVYLWIEDSHIELRDASSLWGKNVWETDNAIKKECKDMETQVLAIGPAGEKRVAIAVPICNRTRAPGGCGTGAVMGAKKLKAVAIRGTLGIKVAQPDEFEEACADAYKQVTTHPIYESWSKYGTPILLGIYNKAGGLPSYNWQRTEFEGWEQLDGPTFVEKHVVKSKGCFNCPLHCSHYYVIEEGSYAGTKAEGVEYEATDGFGARCGIKNLPATLYANYFCNVWGVCVVQAANYVSVPMHLWQDGIINHEDTGGLTLEWGNDKAMVELVAQISRREGFGATFSDGLMKGLRKIAEKKGLRPEALERYVIQSKGMTLSSYEPRYLRGASLEMGTSTRGADHLRGLPTIEVFGHWYRNKPEQVTCDLDVPPEIVDQWMKLDLLNPAKYEGKGHLVKYYQDQCTVADAVEICKFLTSWRFGVGPQRVARLSSALTGIRFDWKDILNCGDRIWTVEYAMQRRFGLRRKDDFPPVRFFEEPIPSGPNKGAVLDREQYEKMLIEYYSIRGYDSEGVPTRKKLEELNLHDVADDLEARSIRDYIAQ